MKTIDPGHQYDLAVLDSHEVGVGPIHYRLVFVKREGEGYPGNVGHYPGTTMQEVIRALIDRIKYVDNQIPDHRNARAVDHLRNALMVLELRAAERHGRLHDFLERFSEDDCPELLSTCSKCLHIGCEGACHP